MLPRNVLAIRRTLTSAVSSSSPSSTSEIIHFVTSKNSNAFLLDYPPGAYTGMRTFDRVGIMDFTGHTNRLASSLQQISFPSTTAEAAGEHAQEDPAATAGLASFRTPEFMKKETTDLVCSGLKFYYQLQKEAGSTDQQLQAATGAAGAAVMASVAETKVTVLCTWDPKDKAPILTAHFEPLKTPKTPRCKVEVHGAPREHATAKDSQWVRDRSKLEADLSPATNEAILMDGATQDLYEGLSSNFFAFDRKQQAVLTAPLDSVLQGTVLKVVLSVCERNKIPVKFSFPNLTHIDEWESAFVSSTSRLVLPIEEMVLPDGTIKRFEESKAIHLIREETLQECKNRVENLLSAQDQ